MGVDSTHLTVGIIEQLLQAVGKRRRQTRRPCCVDETHLDHVEQMDAVLEAPGQ